MNVLVLPGLSLLNFLKRASTAVCVALILFFLTTTGCKTLENIITHPPSTDAVKGATIFVVAATREAALLPPYGGPALETALNAFILVVHNGLLGLAADVQKGVSALPTRDEVSAFLTSKAAAFGSPDVIKNFIGNLVTEYGKFYAFAAANEPTAYAYLTAFAQGTI